MSIQYDEVVKRDRWSRVLVFIATSGIVLVAPFLLVQLFGLEGKWGHVVNALAILASGMIYVHLLPRRLLNIVPQVQGFVSQDPIFGGEMIIYGPGLHVPFPWERRDVKSNTSLEVISSTQSVAIPTKTSAVEIEFTYQYEGDLSRQDRFIATDESTIDEGFKSRITSEISENVAGKNLGAEEVIASGVVDLNEKMKELFGSSGSLQKVFLEEYGVRVKVVKINKITLPVELQKTRDAEEESKAIIKGIAYLYGMKPEVLIEKLENGGISDEKYRDMLKHFMAISGNATMVITEGTAGDAIATAVNKMVGGGK